MGFEEIDQRPSLAYIGETIGDSIGEHRPPYKPIDALPCGSLCCDTCAPLERLSGRRRQDVG
jgi:hypothetical protein